MKQLIHTCTPDINGFSNCGCCTYRELPSQPSSVPVEEKVECHCGKGVDCPKYPEGISPFHDKVFPIEINKETGRFSPSTPEVSWESSLKELLDEYSGCYRVVDNCEDDGYGCKMCLEDRERMQEIAQELEASIRKDTIAEMRALDVATLPERGVLEQKIRREVVEDLSKLRSRICEENFLDVLEMYALSKGIEIK